MNEDQKKLYDWIEGLRNELIHLRDNQDAIPCYDDSTECICLYFDEALDALGNLQMKIREMSNDEVQSKS
ncbi:MAG: hypothetical protein ACTSWQ_06660 [Candidatus Thorarchaeota archaeon]